MRTEAAPASVQCPSSGHVLRADPSNPHYFYHCVDGRVVGNAIPCGIDRDSGEQLAFDDYEQTCVITQLVQCRTRDGDFAYPNNNQKFIKCHHGHGTVMLCAPGTVWSDLAKECN